MKLNENCVRECLLALEQRLSVKVKDSDIRFKDVHITEICSYSELKNYSTEDIAYTIYQLADAGYIVAGNLLASVRISSYSVRTLTYSGHDLLDKIREPVVWKKTKSALRGVAGFSLSLISSVATQVITQLVGKNLSLPSQANP